LRRAPQQFALARGAEASSARAMGRHAATDGGNGVPTALTILIAWVDTV